MIIPLALSYSLDVDPSDDFFIQIWGNGNRFGSHNEITAQTIADFENLSKFYYLQGKHWIHLTIPNLRIRT